jgi:hypothetical protein
VRRASHPRGPRRNAQAPKPGRRSLHNSGVASCARRKQVTALRGFVRIAVTARPLNDPGDASRGVRSGLGRCCRCV